MIKQPTLADGEIDLGDGHWLRFTTWDPDLELNPQWAHLADLIREQPVVGAIVRHLCKTETGQHKGGIAFETEVTKAHGSWGATWTVESWDPLTISPSLAFHCPCNDHGFIRGGKWVRA